VKRRPVRLGGGTGRWVWCQGREVSWQDFRPARGLRRTPPRKTTLPPPPAGDSGTTSPLSQPGTPYAAGSHLPTIASDKVRVERARARGRGGGIAWASVRCCPAPGPPGRPPPPPPPRRPVQWSALGAPCLQAMGEAGGGFQALAGDDSDSAGSSGRHSRSNSEGEPPGGRAGPSSAQAQPSPACSEASACPRLSAPPTLPGLNPPPLAARLGAGTTAGLAGGRLAVPSSRLRHGSSAPAAERPPILERLRRVGGNRWGCRLGSAVRDSGAVTYTW